MSFRIHTLPVVLAFYAFSVMSAGAQTTTTTPTTGTTSSTLPCGSTQNAAITQATNTGQQAALANLNNNVKSPASLASCMGNLMNGFSNANLISPNNNPFNISTGSFNWNSVLNGLGNMVQGIATSAANNLATQLTSQVCSTIQQAVNSVTQPITNSITQGVNGATQSITGTLSGTTGTTTAPTGTGSTTLGTTGTTGNSTTGTTTGTGTPNILFPNGTKTNPGILF